LKIAQQFLVFFSHFCAETAINVLPKYSLGVISVIWFRTGKAFLWLTPFTQSCFLNFMLVRLCHPVKIS